MRVVIPQITWHCRDPVLSVDFDPSCKGEEEGYYRFATGGGDCQLLVWRLTDKDSFKPELTCVAELKRHEKPVNVVRFCTDGTCIASGGDDAYIILWKCGEKGEKEENWAFEKSLRKHIEDVSDLSWSQDGCFLISSSIDNSAVLWDIKKGVALQVWSEKEHTGFVHGVAYDPLNELAATICIDRNLRFFDLKSSKLAYKALKYPDEWLSQCGADELESEEKENDPSNAEGENKEEDDGVGKKKSPAFVNRLFQDEFLPTFCRRLSFSPKGELLLVPGGLLPPGHTASDSKIKGESDEVKRQEGAPAEEEGDIKAKEKRQKKKVTSNNNAVVVFCRHSWTNPCAVIPTLDSYSIASRFCPIYFKKTRKPYTYDSNLLIPKKNERSFACVGKISAPKEEKFSLMNMPYRLVYAVATNNTVLIGDTASTEPLAVIRSIHLARITDITWASDGQALVVSSTDGYCSVITFDKGELGEEYSVAPENFPVLTRDCFPVLPPEPKTVKVPKKKKAQTPKVKAAAEVNVEDKEAKTEVKTPVSSKKKPVVQSNNIAAMFSSAKASQGALDKKPNVPEILAIKAESETTGSIPSAEGVTEPTGQQHESAAGEQHSENTPKFKPQKTTLDRWFTKAAKPSGKEPEKKSNGEVKSSPKCVKSKKGKPSDKVTPARVSPEVICLDLDDDNSDSTPMPILEPNLPLQTTFSKPASSKKPPAEPRIYPMTPPPIAKPIAARRLSSAASPLVSSPNGGGQKRKQGEITPEELFKLENAPLKCRRLMEEPKLIMESSNSNSAKSTKSMISCSQEPTLGNSCGPLPVPVENVNDVAKSSKVPESNCPPSPVSSSTSTAPRPPRRIMLTPVPYVAQSKEGKLD